jgi:hypothetical protein
MRRAFGVARLSLLVALVSLALTALSIPAQAGSTKSSTYTASISPPKVTLGDSTAFTLQLAVAPSSSNSLGSVQVVVPAGFTVSSLGPATTPSGWLYSTPSCSSDSPAGCGAAGATLVQVATPSGNGANKVLPGQVLTISVTATVSGATGARTWAVAGKNSAAWSTGQLLTLSGSSPSVTVYPAPAKVAFGTPPPSTTVAGQTFGATVNVLDANDQPTISTAQVTVSGTSLTGTTTVSAVAGTATFSGLSLTKAGTITVTASSGSLTPAGADVVVTPGPPAKLVVSAPSAVTAGDALGVDVTVTDAYDNPVDPQVGVDLAVDGATVASQTTVGGSTSFSVPAPTSAGTHSLTVSSSGLTQTQSFTVAAGPPVALTIDSVTDEGGVGVLTKNAPFDVTVTARDTYGNPSPYTGTVALATSGGTGNGLGTVTGTTTGTFSAQTSVTVVGAVYTGYGNTITLTASAAGLTDATTNIDVSLFVTSQNASPNNSLTLTNSGCTDATPQVPVCSSLILPKGANGLVTLAQGACNPFTPCLTGAQNQALLVQGIANLRDNSGRLLYSRTSPAAVQLRCDKTLCGGTGANGFPILYQPSGGGPFLTAPACPKKGTIGPNQTFCQDFTQNHRDNAGDLVAYLLFLDDVRSTFG